MYSWEEIKLHFSEHLEHERVVTMQYTGLKDKNGKGIYEGDILNWDPKEWGGKYHEVVIFDYEQLSSRMNDWYKFCEVIGNTFENPELTEG
jgi:hypothetical protein